MLFPNTFHEGGNKEGIKDFTKRERPNLRKDHLREGVDGRRMLSRSYAAEEQKGEGAGGAWEKSLGHLRSKMRSSVRL